MSKFKPGDLVRCINASMSDNELILGKEYVVEKCDPSYGNAMKLVGQYYPLWDPRRFEPISSTPTPPPVSLPKECKCGIYRNDCTYHQDLHA